MKVRHRKSPYKWESLYELNTNQTTPTSPRNGQLYTMSQKHICQDQIRFPPERQTYTKVNTQVWAIHFDNTKGHTQNCILKGKVTESPRWKMRGKHYKGTKKHSGKTVWLVCSGRRARRWRRAARWTWAAWTKRKVAEVCSKVGTLFFRQWGNKGEKL